MDVKKKENILYYGDNLVILRNYFKDESVDLIYLDPPFNSDEVFNVIFSEQNGTKSSAQIKVFEDTWHWNIEAESNYKEMVERGGKISAMLQGYRQFLGEGNLMAYLVMMAPRLVELHRVLKPTGSLYLHCDPTASHYLKLMLDAIFGMENFQNEIIWCYSIGGRSKRRYAEKHDIIFFYSKSKDFVFNGSAVAIPRPKTHMKIVRKEDGREYQVKKDAKTGKEYFYAIDEGKIPEDWWHIETLNREDKERLGYPTQKPELLLERIIGASSNINDVVLDPFAGCGTTISVAERLRRRWAAIDITFLAITLIKNRLITAFPDRKDSFSVIGEPTTLTEAKSLAELDKYQFQWWALSLAGARPADHKKGADRGIDGRKLFFEGSDEKMPKQIIISVKGGENITVKDVRDLRGVIEREKASIGILISMESPTKPMVVEAASAGFYEPTTVLGNPKYPRIQIFTIEELLAGKQIEYPRFARDVTLKPAQRVKEKKSLAPQQKLG